MRGQPDGRIAEKLIHANGRAGVVGRDVVPNVGAALFRFWRPDDYHVWPAAAWLRLAANAASTSSFDRPTPARIEARPAST